MFQTLQNMKTDDILFKTAQELRDASSPKTENNQRIISFLGNLMARNYRSVYDDTDEDKEIIFKHISNKVEYVKSSKNIIHSTGKKLVYFSIFSNEYFIKMLDDCLKTIVKYTPKLDFDILFITDEFTKSEIEKLGSIKNFSYKYFILDTPQNGIEASFNKLQIINFSELNNYEKVLYLDVDIWCIKDINILFNMPMTPGILHVRSNKSKYITSDFTLPTNGLMFLTEKLAQYILDTPNLTPFNAGQFVFINCSHIQEHIKNTLWLSEIWPGIHFFEQSFMNSYFSLHGLTEQESLSLLVEIISSKFAPAEPKAGEVSGQNIKPDYLRNNSKKQLTVLNAINSRFAATPDEISIRSVSNDIKYKKDPTDGVRSKEREMSFAETLKTNYIDLEKKHTADTVLIHFAGWSVNGRQKLHFINTYANAHQLST